MKKRIISTLLALVLVLSMLPVTAGAADDHTHCVCGSSTSCGDSHNSTQAWIETATLPTAAGYYCLTADVETASTWTPKDGIFLCLNGHKITFAGTTGSAIRVGENVLFTLSDCGSTGKITGGKGTDAGNYIGPCGGGVYNFGTFVMFGGNIFDNSATRGGGVHNSGTFIMRSGSISENSATRGGGVYNSGNFTMYNGAIESNGTSGTLEGGGVYNTNSGCVFTLFGGTINSNKASKYGAGVYNSINAMVAMAGGSITSNKITDPSNYTGAGVYNYGGKFNMTGGTVSFNSGGNGYMGSICVGGTAKIINNPSRSSSSQRNLFRSTGPSVTIGVKTTDEDGNETTIYLTKGAQIGVTTETAPTDSAPVDITKSNSADYSAYFTSDSPLYYVNNSGTGDAQVVQLGTSQAHTHTYDQKVTTTVRTALPDMVTPPSSNSATRPEAV